MNYLKPWMGIQGGLGLFQSSSHWTHSTMQIEDHSRDLVFSFTINIILYCDFQKCHIFVSIAFKSQKMTSPQSPVNASVPTHLSLHSLIQSDPILAQFFQTKIHSFQDLWPLAHQLMIDGIRYQAVKRIGNVDSNQFQNIQEPPHLNVKQIEKSMKETQKTNHNQPGEKKVMEKKHYNVAYVKHNRFLSPTQRKEFVSPKVTEVIPRSPPHVIYGKPKVRTDNNFGCPYHETEQNCLRAIPYADMDCSEAHRPIHEIHVRNTDSDPRISKSPPTIANYETKNFQKTQKMRLKQDHSPKQEKEKTIYVNKILQVKTRSPGMVRIVNQKNTRHSKYEENEGSESCPSQYLQQKSKKKPVQSKIKFLVERDKKNKALERDLRKQEERIKALEQTVKNTQNKNKAKISEKDIISLSSDTSMSLLDSQVIKEFKQNRRQNNKNDRKNNLNVEISDSGEGEGEEEIDCSCSQTLNEQEGSVDSEESSFAEFKITD